MCATECLIERTSITTVCDVEVWVKCVVLLPVLDEGSSLSRVRQLQSSSSVDSWYKVWNICLIFLHMNFPCYKIIVEKKYFITCFDAMNLLNPSQYWMFWAKIWTKFIKRHIFRSWWTVHKLECCFSKTVREYMFCVVGFTTVKRSRKQVGAKNLSLEYLKCNVK